MTIDMLWNVLTISPRAIALALFASYQLHWFWGLVIAQILIVTILNFFHMQTHAKNYTQGIFVDLVISFCTGISMIFNMLFYQKIRFYIYVIYWFVMMIENIVMISLWFAWSSELALWYQDIAIGCILSSYLLSFIIEFTHSYFHNELECNVLEWRFSE